MSKKEFERFAQELDGNAALDQELSADELDLVAGGASALMVCKGGTGKCTCDGTTWCPWNVFCATVHYYDSERPVKEWDKILDSKTLEDPDA